MAIPKMLVFLVFMVSETLVLGDSLPVKVPVRDEFTDANVQNKQRSSVNGSRLDLPPYKGPFSRVTTSVTSSVSSSVARLDGDHGSNKRRTDPEPSAGSTDEDPENRTGRRTQGRKPENRELFSRSFNFDDFISSVMTGDEETKTERREPVKPMPTQIKLEALKETVVATRVDPAKRRILDIDPSREKPAVDLPQGTLKTNPPGGGLKDSLQSEAQETKVRRKRPRKRKRLRNNAASKSLSENGKSDTSEPELQLQDTQVNSSVPSAASKLSEKVREKLFPSRRSFPSGATRKVFPMRSFKKKLANSVLPQSTTSTTIPPETSTTTNPVVATAITLEVSTTIRPRTSATVRHQSNLPIMGRKVEQKDPEFASYEELTDPAPPNALLTPTPVVMGKPTLTNPPRRPIRPKIKSKNPNRARNPPVAPQSLRDETDVTKGNQTPTLGGDPAPISVGNPTPIPVGIPSLIPVGIPSLIPVENSIEEAPSDRHASTPLITNLPKTKHAGSNGVKANPRQEAHASTAPPQFDYSDYEDIVEYYDEPEGDPVGEVAIDKAELNINDGIQYGYKVNEKETGNFQARTESRDGDTVYGSYEVVLPDGRIQLVKYEADDGGFRAEVIYKEGEETSPTSPDTPAKVEIREGQQRKASSSSSNNEVATPVKPRQPTKQRQTAKARQPTAQININTRINIDSRNSHMTPWPETNRHPVRTPQSSRGRAIERGDPVVNTHFLQTEKERDNPIHNKNLISGFNSRESNHEAPPLSDERNSDPRPEPVPKAIPPHGHREVAKIPPNPFVKKRQRQKPHMPVKPQPKLVSTISPTQPPVHPLLDPGVFNRPVHFDNNNKNNFGVTESTFPQRPPLFTQQPTLFTQQPPLFTQQPHSFTQQPHSFTQQPHSFTQQPHSFTQRPTSSPQRPTSFTQRPPSFAHQPASFPHHPSSIQHHTSIQPHHNSFPNANSFPHHHSSFQRQQHNKFSGQHSPITTQPTFEQELDINDLPEDHLPPPSQHHFHNPFIRGRSNEFEDSHPLPHPEAFPIPKQLQSGQNQRGKLDFSEDFPVTTPSPNPFKLVIERVRPSTYNPRPSHFAITPTPFPLPLRVNAGTPFFNQPNFSDSDIEEVPHIELLKTPVVNRRPIFGNHVDPRFDSPLPQLEARQFEAAPNPQFAVHEERFPTTTLRPRIVNVVRNDRVPTTTPPSVFDSFPKAGQRDTKPTSPSKILSLLPQFEIDQRTPAPIQLVPTPVPRQVVTTLINQRTLVTIPSPPPIPDHFRVTTTPAPFRSTTTSSKPFFFKYSSLNGTPSPTLVYHPNNPVYIRALGQTHAIPLLLPFEGVASEKSEIKIDSADRQNNGTLTDKELKFNKSDIYPEPPPRLLHK